MSPEPWVSVEDVAKHPSAHGRCHHFACRRFCARALVPIENKRQFLEVNPDLLEQVDPIFYDDLRQAAFKALGLN